MQKNLRNVVRKEGDYTIPLLSVETVEEMELGHLFGLNGDGLAVVANASTGIHAIGVVTKTSAEGFGEAFKLNGANKLKVGEYIDVYTHAVVYAEECMTGEVGDLVYLGEAGKLTLTKPVAGIAQVVGALANPKTGAVRLAIMGKGEAVA